MHGRRLPLLALGGLALLTGVWGGLARLAFPLPLPGHAGWVSDHGALMVGAFLGTLIGLERAVALGRRWAHAAPLLTGAGGLLLIAGVPGPPGRLCITAGSLLFVPVTLQLWRRRPALPTACGLVAALLWLAGNVLWCRSLDIPAAVPWWAAFLVLTIAGERLELSRLQAESRGRTPLFLLAALVLLAGVLASPWARGPGLRVAGAGFLGLGLWALRHDLARRTVREHGLTRFVALCLLSGHVWLTVSGALLLAQAPAESGFEYDSALHALFLGFVVSMIFGHAPIIFPAVLGRPVPYRPRYFAHVALLNAALLLRVAGDLGHWIPGRRYGALFGAVAILMFLISTVAAVVSAENSP